MTTATVSLEEATDTATAIAAVEEQMSLLFHRVRARWKDAAAAVHPDLQPAGYKLLSMIVRGGPAHAGSLAEKLHTDKSVISRQVRMLEECGLVESRADEHDGRARILVATPLAVEKLGHSTEVNIEQLRDLLRTWDPTEIRSFAEYLGRLASV